MHVHTPHHTLRVDISYTIHLNSAWSVATFTGLRDGQMNKCSAHIWVGKHCQVCCPIAESSETHAHVNT